jgi:hypothetical protein
VTAGFQVTAQMIWHYAALKIAPAQLGATSLALSGLSNRPQRPSRALRFLGHNPL